jgi:hypothetical protein
MASMVERITILFVDAFYLYALLGLVFALAFITIGVQRIDSQANGSSTAFRLLLLLGSAAFWPLLLRRWIAGKNEPPVERDPHS